MQRGDVVLVHVPFVGAAGGKLRPALVVQDDLLNQVLRETIVAEITSDTRNVHRPNQVLIEISIPGTGLLMDSAVRAERLHTIPQADVQRVIGGLPAPLMQRVQDALKSALGI